MKRLALLLFLLAFSASAFAVYCDEQPTLSTCQCRQMADAGAWIDLPDTIEASAWFNTYCSSSGFIRQKRAVLEIVKPACDQRAEYTEYQDVPYEICKSCPPPKVLSSWQAIQCAGSKTVYQRNIIAYYYSQEVSECELGQWVELKTEAAGACSTAIGTVGLAAANNLLMLAVVAAIAALATVLYFKKIKK